MAKKVENIQPIDYEDFVNIFEVVGGSINEDEDVKVFNAINELPCDDSAKIRFLVQFSRSLERANHYLRR